jgi:transposase
MFCDRVLLRHVSITEHMPMSKDETAPARRVEVFTGSGRRRSWGIEEKARIVAESYVGGETVSAVARRHGLTSQQLFGWRRASRVPIDFAGSQSSPSFVPAVMETADRKPKGVDDGNPLIGFDLAGASVWICGGADAEVVTAIIHALKATK